MEQLKWCWDTFGVSGGILFILWRVFEYLKPKIEVWFDKHFKLMDTLTDSAKHHADHHTTTHIGLVCIGNAISDAASDDKKPQVVAHVTMLKEQIGLRTRQANGVDK